MVLMLSLLRQTLSKDLGVRWSEVPRYVRIVDVAPRDGLQNEKKIISTDNKLKLIHSLADAGLKGIEITAFVSSKWVPQMSDHEVIATSLPKQSSISFPVLIPNLKGLEKAIQCGVKEVALLTSVSDTFIRRNTNCSLEENLTICHEVIRKANLVKGMRVRGYISCAFGCPYEGAVEPKKVFKLLQNLLNAGCYEVSLADTIGIATPGNTDKLLRTIAEYDTTLLRQVAMHFHNTKKQGLANVLTALQFGIGTYDTSVGGIGGCPYAAGATGNLSTESLVYMLDGMDIHTGIDLQKLQEVAQFAVQLIQG